MKESISDIIEECSRITLEQKNSEDISSFTSALFFLCGLELLAIVALYIKEGFSNKLLLFLSVLIIMLLSYKWKLSQADSEVMKKTPNTAGEDQVAEKIDYLNAGLNMKLVRISSIKWFYITVFPVFLFSIQQLCKGLVQTTYSHWLVPVVLILSYFIWGRFFSSDKKKIEVIQNRVNYLSSTASTIAKN